MVAGFVDIDGIVDHHSCLNILFMNLHTRLLCIVPVFQMLYMKKDMHVVTLSDIYFSPI